MKKQILSLLIEYEDEKIVVHLEVDKEKFKMMIEPFLNMAVGRLCMDKADSSDQKKKEDAVGSIEPDLHMEGHA